MGLEIEYIEGQTPLDEEEKEGLLIRSITTRGELDEFEQLNIEKAIVWTLGKRFKPEQVLSEEFIKDLHKRMYGDVWAWAGQFRRSEKNIGIRSYRIAIALKQLCDDCSYWIADNTYSEEEIAVRFKHNVVSIHCFSNGNGRHSRLMADIIINNMFNKPLFTWSRANLNKKSDARSKYLAAVKAGDQGDILPLIVFARS